MKILLVLCTLLVSSFSHAAMAPKSDYKFVGDLKYATFCKAVIEDNVELLEKSIKRHSADQYYSSRENFLKRAFSDDGIKCNGVDLLAFSKMRDAVETYAFLTKSK